jgi:hypothetical protein
MGVDKLPDRAVFPDGSFILKEVQSSVLATVIYKKSGSWLWAEINAEGITY